MSIYRPYTMTCRRGPTESPTVTVAKFDTRSQARSAWDEEIWKARRNRERLRIELETPWGVSRHTERADRDNFNTDRQPRLPWWILPVSLALVVFITLAATGSFAYH